MLRRYRASLAFVGLAYALSALFWVPLVRQGFDLLLITAVMWSPGVAAVVVSRYTGREPGALGWRWGGARAAWIAYLLPLAYGLLVYGLAWLTGLGRFYDTAFVEETLATYGLEALPPGVGIGLFVLLTGTAGLVAKTGRALGEEIGWRGFLVPELARHHDFGTVSVVTGVIWAAWHYPLLLLGDFYSGPDRLVSLGCFTVMVVGISFPFAFYRLKTGSVWPAAIMHGSHNLFIQSIFTPLTAETAASPWVLDEFGVGLAAVGVVLAAIYWRRRHELPGVTPAAGSA